MTDTQTESLGQKFRGLVRRFRFLIVGAAVALAILILLVLEVFYGANTFTDSSDITLIVSRGQTFASVVDSLDQKGIIRDRGKFIFVARLLGGAQKIQVGKYLFTSGVSNTDIFLTLRSGRGNILIPVVIPEGLRAGRQARIYTQMLGIDSTRFVGLVHDADFARSLDLDAASLEGYLLPDTYAFYWQPDEKEILRRMVHAFHDFFSDSLKARAAELNWTVHQAVTMASIVEGEAVLDEERGRISGVYHNRLKKHMRLEADPTIQYILSDGPRRVLYTDLKIDHPYNTYRNFGLPPGPVNNPGRESILAALFPEVHNYLFFVANGKGGHWFTSNFQDHLRYVRQYRRHRRAVALSMSGNQQSR